MLNLVKLAQFFVPSQDVEMASISPSERANIQAVWGESQVGTVLGAWRPTDSFPSLSTLKADRAYLMRSTLPFSPHSIDIQASGLHPYSSSVGKVYQMLTYRGESSFDLGGLSPSVRSKIKVILSESYTESGSIRQWGPDNALNTLNTLVPGSTYLIESVSEGFVPYDLGLPPEASSSSSSATPSSSSSSPPCGQVFNTTLTAVLGAGVSQGLPEEFYYAGAVGMSIVSGASATLQYNNLGTSGISISTEINIGGEIVAGINPSADYTNQPFAFTYGGNTYCGTFVDGLVTF